MTKIGIGAMAMTEEPMIDDAADTANAPPVPSPVLRRAGNRLGSCSNSSRKRMVKWVRPQSADWSTATAPPLCGSGRHETFSDSFVVMTDSNANPVCLVLAVWRRGRLRHAKSSNGLDILRCMIESPSSSLLGLSDRFCRHLHWFAVSWSLVAIAGLALASPLDLLDHRPGGAAFEISVRPVFMVLFLIGLLVSLKWEIAGAIVSAFTASGLVVFAYQQLKPTQAVIVIVAFSVPAILWIVIDVSDHQPGTAAVGLALTMASVVAGAVVASNVYDTLFGPTHPSSVAAALPESALDWIWSGAVTHSSFSVTAKLDDEATSVRLVVTSSDELSDHARGTRGVRRTSSIPICRHRA